MNSRRRMLIVLGAAALLPRAVLPQAKQPILIGWLHTDSRELGVKYLDAFKAGLAELGWKVGAQILIEERWAGGRIERLPPLAEELAAKKPAIIVATNPAAVRAAAKAAPKTSIVMASGSDPVAMGFAKSLAQPGGVITGVSSLGSTIAEKYLEFLLAAAPKVKRVGVLVDANAPIFALMTEAVRRSVAQYKVDARFAEVTSPEEIESALVRLAKEGVQGLIVTGGLMVRNERRRVAEFALAQRWPLVAGPGGWAEAGALISYSADVLTNYRRAAYYVDRILKGAKPGDIPIEQPTTFDFVVNLKTAKTLGLTMPPEIMLRANRVIER